MARFKSSEALLLASLSITLAVFALVTVVNCDYGVFGFLDGEYDMRICPGYAKPDFCDKKRDLLWILKGRGKVWGHRCRKNLQGIIDNKNITAICGAVIRGSEKMGLCQEYNSTKPNHVCRRTCRGLFNSLSGTCTIGNKKRERCVCYIHKIKTSAT